MKKHLRVFSFTASALMSLSILMSSSERAESDPPPSIQAVYRADVRPLLNKYCFECHGATKPKGDIRLDALSVDFVKGKETDLEIWHEVLQNLHRGEMPPRGKAQPTKQEHGVIVDWLNRAFVEARQQRESTGGKIVMRRLTSYEFQNTLEDLLEVKLDFSKNLLPESASRDGFLNNGTFLATSSQHVKGFWAAARFAMSKAIVTGPQPKIHKTRFDTYHPYFSMKPGKKQQMAKVPEPPADNEHRDFLLPDTSLMVPVAGMPAKGRFRVRINVRASGPDTYLLTWFKFSVGDLPALALVKRDVIASSENQNIDIYGNIEDFGYLADRLRKGVSPAAYLCVSNVGGNHNAQKIGAGTYLHAVDPAKVRQLLDAKAKAPKTADDVSAVRINFIEIEAPFIETPVSGVWPPSYHRRILFDSANVKDEPVYAREVIGRFMERAFRRPVQKAEVDPYVAAFQKLRPNVDDFEDAIRETLATVLVSPQFLVLVEPRAAKAGKAPVTDYEWAARLSYFLWNSMPDAELIQLAGNGTLKDPGVQKRQVERLLQDRRSWRFIETFTDQWLNLSALEKVAVNPEFHPKFDESLKQDMRRETQLFFNEFVKNDLNCLKLVSADFTYLNNRLADHYGIRHGPGTGLNLGLAFQRVSLAPEHKRGCGLLTHASVLLLNSDGVESHPIKRAVWVRNAIFDDPPPDPPAEVPELKTEDRAKSALTLKQRIEQHRSSATCAHCHARVDPWGIVLEQYDALGRFRTEYSSLGPTPKKGKNAKAKLQVVDAKAELPDGHAIDGVEDLKAYVLSHGKERFARAIVRKTLAYALGRSIEVGDQPLVEELTRDFAANDYRFRALIQAVVGSEAFLTK